MTKEAATSTPNEPEVNMPKYQKLILKIGDWKGLLPVYELKIAIAVALNQCVERHNMQLFGYWITTDQVNLIIGGTTKQVDRKLDRFYDLFVSAIANHLLVTTGKGHVWKNWQKHFRGSLSDLFDRGLLHDPNLIKLLLGQEATLPYHDTEVEKLKLLIKQEDFCSAIDYFGAEGPVKVKTEWRKL